MSDSTSFRTLMEKVKAENEVRKIKLPVKDTALSPVFSKKSIDIHYGTLYTNYVKKALAGEGDFQVAGAKLHTLFFEQMKSPSENNNPVGDIKDLILKKFTGFSEFKNAIKEEALGIHGSGWVYLSTTGSIKTIKNHEIVSDVALIIDMWEHSYFIDYGADKEKYLRDIWKIINWNIINERLV